MQTKVIKRVELKKSEHELLANGIIKVRIVDGVTIDVPEIELIRATNLELSNGEKCVVFVDPGNYAHVTADARKLTGSREHAQYRKAQAFVARTAGERILGNFYLRVQKPNHPTRMFSYEEEAMEWLQQFID